MSEFTKIEWADHTFNPWIGCTRVSPACDHCYAEVLMGQRYKRVKWGAGQVRQRTSKANWRKPITWNRKAVAAGTRPFVFCASLADVFDNEVDPCWRSDLFDLIEVTPQLVWLLLTKRIGNVLKMAKRLPPSVAIGSTMANQEEYDRDNPKLLEAKSTLNPLFTFGSFEPLLGPIQLDQDAPDWVIVGGESGPSARPMDLDWARSLRDQCDELDRVFNFKQVGGTGKGNGGHTLDGEIYFDRPSIVPSATPSSKIVVRSVAVDKIVVGDRCRAIRNKAVDDLAGSMKVLGLKLPLSVRISAETVDGTRKSRVPLLVAGAHRLAAAKQLGWTHIDCIEMDDDELTLEMWEIAENLHRRSLTKKERDEHVRRYAELLEARRDHSRQNGTIESKRADGRGHRRKGIASEIAEETGLSKRTINRALADESTERKQDGNPGQTNPPQKSVQQSGRSRLTEAWEAASLEDRVWFIHWIKASQDEKRQTRLAA